MAIDRDTELKNGLIRLYPPNLKDAPGLYAAVRESINSLKPWMSWCHDNYAIEETIQWIEHLPNAWENDLEYQFVITEAGTGTILGGCGLNRIDRAYQMANLGYWVISSHRGEGFAGQAARLVAQFAMEHLGLVRVEIVVAVGNQASLRVAEKLTATREGVLRNRILIRGTPHDAVMHSLIPQDFTQDK
jgi:ribosomal-protein-serine acetyltransferase